MPNAGGRHDILRHKKLGQETNASNTGEGDMDFRGKMDVGGPEDVPEAETHSGTTRTLGGDEHFSCSTSGVQETEGEYVRGGD